MKKGITITLIALTVLSVGLTKIKASTFNNEWISGMQYNKNGGSWQTTTLTNDLFHTFTDSNLGANRYFTKFSQRYDFSDQIKELRFNVKFRLNESTTGELYQPSQNMRCNIHSSTQHPNSGGTMADDVEFEYDYFTCTIPSQNPSLEIQDLNFSLSLQTWFNDNVDLRSPCYAVSNSGDTYSFSCPIGIYNRNVNGLIIQLSTPFTYDFSVGVSDLFSMEYDSSQAIINNQNQNTQAIIEQNATYEDTPSQDMTNETQEMNDFEEAEQNLINSLDLNMSIMDGITINPNASAYIWQIVDRLRQINPAIILLMTSILGMGVIKLVLNR